MRKSLLMAYMAAYIDGEGCIRINNRCPAVEISNTFPNTLLMFQDLFGGRIRKMKSRFMSKNRTCWHYCVYGKKAIRLLEKLIPYLREKREQARVLLKWFSLKRGTKKSMKLRIRLKALKRIDYATIPKHHRDYQQQKDTL